MNGYVMVRIPVSEKAAKLLDDEVRAERVGRLVSDMLSPESPAEDPLAALIAEIKADTHADGLTDEEIDAELAAYNAERRI